MHSGERLCTLTQATALSAWIKIVKALHLFSQADSRRQAVSTISQQVTVMAVHRARLLCQESCGCAGAQKSFPPERALHSGGRELGGQPKSSRRTAADLWDTGSSG